MNSTIHEVTAAILATNAILASALGAVLLYRGIKKRCQGLIRSSVVMFCFSIAYVLTARGLADWAIGLLPAVWAIWLLKVDSALDTVDARLDSVLDRIASNPPIPPKG